MKTLQTRRIFSLLGGLMIGACAGVAADVIVNPSSPSATPGFGLFLAGLGIGAMAASSLRD